LQGGDGKRRVFNLQTHHKDGRAAEGNNLGLLGLLLFEASKKEIDKG
jgi:hypothetical protein